MRNNRRFYVLMFGLLVVFASGCATTKIDLYSGDGYQLPKKSRINFQGPDKLDTAPDNLDGFINLLWTNNEKKKRVVLSEYHKLQERLKQKGTVIENDKSASDITAILFIKSVRFDPLGGWITDGARVDLFQSSTGEKLASIQSGDALITPSLSGTFKRLGDGVIQFLGL